MPLKNYDDKLNKKIGQLIIIEIDSFVDKGVRRQCLVSCPHCGENKKLPLHKVLEGKYKSCGCLSRIRENMKKTDYTLYVSTVLHDEYVESYDRETREFTTVCNYCKEVKKRDSYKLLHNRYGACSCLRFHNMSQSSVYERWKSMKARCLNKNSASFHDYGGRGISICAEWIDDFKQFYRDMGNPPSEEYELDRINNDGNYEPSNCRWATKLQNVNNQREKKHNATGYQNVSKRDGKFESSFEYDGRYYYVGIFETAEEAYSACQIKKKKTHKNNKLF